MICVPDFRTASLLAIRINADDRWAIGFRVQRMIEQRTKVAAECQMLRAVQFLISKEYDLVATERGPNAVSHLRSQRHPEVDATDFGPQSRLKPTDGQSRAFDLAIQRCQ